MESMPPTRRAKINGAEQTSASHAKGPAVIMMIDRSSPLAWKNRANVKPSIISNHAIVAVVTAPTAELVEQAADRLTARLTARHGPLSDWFGIGKASGCGSIGWKRLAHRHACRGHASALATSGSVACGMPPVGD